MGLIGARDVLAARAAAPQILPQETLVYIRVANVPETVERFLQTGTGRMFSDPQVRPMVSDAYATAKEAFAQVQEQLGMSLDELLSIPQGEIAFGMFPVEGQEFPGMALIVDCGKNVASARKFFDRLKEMAEAAGERVAEDTLAGTKITVLGSGGGRGPRPHLFEKDSTFVLCPDLESARVILNHWTGRNDRGFEDNAKFAAIMKACSPGRDEQPQMTWYVDPLGMADLMAQGNAGARIGLAILPAMGLDGLHAVGGSLAMAAGEFDMINQIHVLLAIPRAGVLAAIALDSGDLTPEKWVPVDVASYTSMYWDFQKTYDEVEKLVDSFRGQGATADFLKLMLADRIGVDVASDVVPQLAGRVTLISQVMKPVTISSTAQLVAIELKDPKAFQSTLDKFAERLSQINNDLAPEKTSFGGMSYYRIKVPPPPNYQEGDPLPEPSFGIAHGCLMVADREAFFKNIISGGGDSDSGLADQLDFKLIANKAARAAGDSKPGMLSFSRPEEGLRYLYDLANAEQTRKRLEQAGERNPFFRSLGGVLERNPLPPFSTLEKYVSPAGAAMINSETGIHYVSFSLKRK